jgi:hypothetical protein
MPRATVKKLIALSEITASTLENVAIAEGRPQYVIVEEALGNYFAARKGEREEWIREVRLPDGKMVQLREPVRLRVPEEE